MSKVTNKWLADMPAQTIKGNKESSSGIPQDLTVAELLNLLNLGASAVNFSPLSTSGDLTIPTGKALVTGDEFSINGTDTLSIDGDGQLVITG